MQSTLATFAPSEGPQLTGGCRDCHALHRITTFQGAEHVRCVALGYGGPVRDLCPSWWPEDPLVFWPALPDNYSTPLKYLIRAGMA